MSMGRRCAALAALLAMAGCALPPEWQPPVALNTGPNARFGGAAMPPGAGRLPPARLTPLLSSPSRTYEEPSYIPAPEPPFSDGTPFSLDTPPEPEAAPIVPRIAERPPPVRTAAPAPAVPLVGFRPMRGQVSQSY